MNKLQKIQMASDILEEIVTDYPGTSPVPDILWDVIDTLASAKSLTLIHKEW